jgi:spore germination protein KC
MKQVAIFVITGLLFILSGCWDQRELMERGFVLGSAIDQEEDQLKLTVQFYRPSPTEGAGGGAGEEPANFHITSQTISEGARNIVNHVGRRANWSHMQVIVIGEETAKARNLSDLLGFFYREQEPRATTHIVIGQGKGSDYLDIKPIFEDSSGRQLHEIQRFSHEVTGHAKETTIHDLSLQMKSELGISIIPYVTKVKEKIETAPIIGVAIIKNDKMVDELSGIETQSLLVLREEYNRANWRLPCENGNKNQYDNIEVFLLDSNISPKIEGDKVTVDVSLNFEVTLREIVCNTELETVDDVEKYVQYIQEQLEKNLMNTIQKLQENKVDAINIGSRVYQDNPKLWKKVKKDWDQLFAESQYVFDITVDMEGSGIIHYKPFLKK